MLEMKVAQSILSLLLATVVLSDTSEDANNGEFIALAGRRDRSPEILGSGANPSDLPIVKCTFDTKYPTNTTCQVVIRDGSRCNVTYFTDRKTEVVSLYQLPGKKVLLHVRQSLNGQDNMVSKDNLTLVDMDNCAGIYNVSLPTEAKQVFPFEDGGYDVILQDEEASLEDHLRVEHYDASGQRSGESVNVSMHWQQTEVQPASAKFSGRGQLFVHGHSVTGDGPAGFKFLNGSQVKDALELNSRAQLVSHLDADRYYSVCGLSRDDSDWVKVECARLDMQTNVVFKVQLEWTRYDSTRHVRGSESGIVLVGVEERDGFVDKLVIAEARTDERPMVRRIDTPWRAIVKDNCRVLDFDGVARTFTLACEVTFPKRGVAFHKFDTKDSKSWV